MTEHAAARPRDETAVVRRRDAEIILQFLVDVEQGRRRRNPDLHGERKPVRLPVAVIGILSKDDNLRIGKTRIVHRIENRIHIGINAPRSIFLDEERAQLTVIRLCHLRCKQLLPVVLKNCFCHRILPRFCRKFQRYSLFLRAPPSVQNP